MHKVTVSFFPENKTSINNGYRVNLASLMGLCANNYLLLIKLIGDQVALDDNRLFFINDKLSYRIMINEVTKYTSLIHFEQTLPREKSQKRLATPTALSSALLPSMTIRLYHDAKVAEVISTQNIRQIKPRYDYPNKQMHQQNEKQQTNLFLHEWLKLCLALGQVNVDKSWDN